MASYYATMFIKRGDRTSEACGSFGNILIDGRLSENNAMDIAREYFKKEAAFKNEQYAGFKIMVSHDNTLMILVLFLCAYSINLFK